MLSKDLPLGIDVSKWQGAILWKQTAINVPKVHFAAVRATIDDWYMDSKFVFNYTMSQENKIQTTAYHVVRPNKAPKPQAQFFIETMKKVGAPDLPLVLDLELDLGMGKDAIRQNVYDQARYIEDATGKKPMMYSRKNWVEGHLAPKQWLNEYDWWLAIYTRDGSEHQGPALAPEGVDQARVKIHQSTDRGKPIGTESKQMDYDRWQGNEFDFYAYVSEFNGEAPQKPTLTLEERVCRIENILNIS